MNEIQRRALENYTDQLSVEACERLEKSRGIPPRPRLTLAQMKELYATGLSLSRIGKMAGCDHRSVKFMLERSGIKIRSRGESMAAVRYGKKEAQK